MASIFGLLLILVGVLIIWMPKFLAFFVGGAFILFGVGAVALGLKIKSGVTYRRIDPGIRPEE